jgi:hypothetical protein
VVNPFEYAALRLLPLFRRLHLTKLIFGSTSACMFMDYFKGFEKVDAVRCLFGDKTEEVLANLKVEFVWFGYMGVDNKDGHLMVNERYLNSGNKNEIYLDVTHELCR